MIMEIGFLILDSFVQVTIPAPADMNSPAPLEQPWLLLASFTMWFISFFLLISAGRFHVWATATNEGAPSPLLGFVLAFLSSLSMILSSFFYLIVRYPPSPDIDRKE